MNEYVIIAIVLLNFIVFVFYGIDKFRAVNGKYRISEKFLIIMPLFMASAGAMLGMIVFNHKTSKIKFRVCIPLIFILNILTYILFTNFEFGDKIYFIR